MLQNIYEQTDFIARRQKLYVTSDALISVDAKI